MYLGKKEIKLCIYKRTNKYCSEEEEQATWGQAFCLHFSKKIHFE